MASPHLATSVGHPLLHTYPQPRLQLKTTATSTTSTSPTSPLSGPSPSPATASTPAVAAAVVSELPTAASTSPVPSTDAVTATTPNGLASPPTTMPTAVTPEMMNSRKRPTPSSPSDDGSQGRDLKRKRSIDGTAEEVQQRTPDSHDGSRTPEAHPGSDATERRRILQNGNRNEEGNPNNANHKMTLKAKTHAREEEIARSEAERQSKRPRFADLYPKLDDPARTGLQQSIALTLQQAGFDGATPEAMEQFTCMVEEYITDLSTSVNRIALSARRTVPAPVDFQFALPEYNIVPRQLKKHLKPRRRLPEVPVPQDIFEKHFPSTALPDLPVFDLLSGDSDRNSKPFIPPHFPNFPSVHTYQNTAMDARFAAAVAKGEEVDESKEAAEARRRRQEQTVVEAKQAEETLRGFLKATKKRTQKEMSSKALGGKDTGAKNRFLALENALGAFGNRAGG